MKKKQFRKLLVLVEERIKLELRSDDFNTAPKDFPVPRTFKDQTPLTAEEDAAASAEWDAALTRMDKTDKPIKDAIAIVARMPFPFAADAMKALVTIAPRTMTHPNFVRWCVDNQTDLTSVPLNPTR